MGGRHVRTRGHHTRSAAAASARLAAKLGTFKRDVLLLVAQLGVALHALFEREAEQARRERKSAEAKRVATRARRLLRELHELAAASSDQARDLAAAPLRELELVWEPLCAELDVRGRREALRFRPHAKCVVAQCVSDAYDQLFLSLEGGCALRPGDLMLVSVTLGLDGPTEHPDDEQQLVGLWDKADARASRGSIDRSQARRYKLGEPVHVRTDRGAIVQLPLDEAGRSRVLAECSEGPLEYAIDRLSEILFPFLFEGLTRLGDTPRGLVYGVPAALEQLIEHVPWTAGIDRATAEALAGGERARDVAPREPALPLAWGCAEQAARTLNALVKCTAAPSARKMLVESVEVESIDEMLARGGVLFLPSRPSSAAASDEPKQLRAKAVEVAL